MDAQLVAAARIIQAQPPGMDCFQMPAACDQRYVKSRVRQITADAAAHTAGSNHQICHADCPFPAISERAAGA